MLIHRYWTGANEPPITSHTAKLVASKFAQVIDWDDDSLPNNILEDVNTLRNLVPSDQQLRHTSNIIRYNLLYMFGGIWIDHDVVLFKPPASNAWVANHGAEVCPSAMRFPSKHPILEAALDGIHKADRSSVASGGNHLTRVINGSRGNISREYVRVDKIMYPIDVHGVVHGDLWAINFSNGCRTVWQ